MKKLLSLMAVAALCLGTTQAHAVTYTLNATVPLATGVGFTVNRIVAATGVATAVTGTTLTFNPLVFNTANQIYLPNHYYSIAVAPVGGAGSPQATVSYAEGTNPNAPGHGLGWKTVATFVKAVGAVETVIPGHGKKMLKDLTSENVTAAETAGGILKLYVGIVTKDPAAVPPDPAASEPFTNADAAGTYTGTLTITGTVA